MCSQFHCYVKKTDRIIYATLDSPAVDLFIKNADDASTSAIRIQIRLYCLSQMLLDFLDRVAKEPANKMTAENIAMVVAPNLFLVSSGSRSRPQAVDRELQLAMATSQVTLLMLANRHSLWTVNEPLCSLFVLGCTYYTS